MASTTETPAAATDLISFLKALPDCRMRRGIRFPVVDAAGGDPRDPERPGFTSGHGAFRTSCKASPQE